MHPSFPLCEAMSSFNVATQPALEWGVERLLPESAIVYGLPRALRGESSAAMLKGPFFGALVTGPRELEAGGVLPAGALVERVDRSRVVKQWESLRRSRKMVGDGTYIVFKHETAAERDAVPDYQLELEFWRDKLDDDGLATLMSSDSFAARVLDPTFKAEFERLLEVFGKESLVTLMSSNSVAARVLDPTFAGRLQQLVALLGQQRAVTLCKPNTVAKRLLSPLFDSILAAIGTQGIRGNDKKLEILVSGISYPSAAALQAGAEPGTASAFTLIHAVLEGKSGAAVSRALMAAYGIRRGRRARATAVAADDADVDEDPEANADKDMAGASAGASAEADDTAALVVPGMTGQEFQNLQYQQLLLQQHKHNQQLLMLQAQQAQMQPLQQMMQFGLQPQFG